MAVFYPHHPTSWRLIARTQITPISIRYAPSSFLGHSRL